MLGLPIIGGGEAAGRQLRKESAALLYLRNRGLSFAELGSLDARPGAAERNDGCRASCVDWYGNSRPLFVRGRVFALMGYEIVEGATHGEADRRDAAGELRPAADRDLQVGTAASHPPGGRGASCYTGPASRRRTR